MARQYVAIPAVPTTGVGSWEGSILNALKENVELLTGQRRGVNLDSVSLTKGDITINPLETVNIQRISARGRGYDISGQQVPSLEDYGKLLTDVQLAINDITILRNTVNSLIVQLRG